MADSGIDLALLSIDLIMDICITMILWLWCGHAGGQVQIDACVAKHDGGALYALAPVQFLVVLPSSNGEVEVNEPRTTIAGNVAGARGGGIAAWTPISVGFGYRLVCKFV
jgi:hypothetical protein